MPFASDLGDLLGADHPDLPEGFDQRVPTFFISNVAERFRNDAGDVAFVQCFRSTAEKRSVPFVE